MYYMLDFSASMFQAGWFIASIATQILVIHVIRTRKMPFIESCGHKYLCITTCGCVVFGWVIPYTFIGTYFHFAILPISVCDDIVVLT